MESWRGMEHIMRNLDKIERWLLYAMVVTIPVNGLPKAYPIPDFMKNVPYFFLILLVVLAVVHYMHRREDFGNWSRGVKWYLALCILWPFLCTIIGAVQFPYWDEKANEFLRGTTMVKAIAHVYPAIMTNETLLHLKYGVSMLIGTVKSLLLPLLGIPFALYVMFHGKTKEYILDTISRAAVLAASTLCLYSLVEIPWLLTGNEFCEGILKWINVHLYDPANSHGWWPPLLWKGQLRSFAYEPSYFGIEALFLLPLLWYRALELKEKHVGLVLILFTYMLFLTHARTAQVIYLGELLLLIFLFLLGRYPDWGKRLVQVFIVTGLAFSIYLVLPMALSAIQGERSTSALQPVAAFEKYVSEDVASVWKKSQRSNMARLGNTVALFNVGVDHPLVGVGTGFVSPYMTDHIPDFAREDGEINLWKAKLGEKGFMKSGYPILNTFGRMVAFYGIIGLFLFAWPIIYAGIKILKGYRCMLRCFGHICVIVALAGQIVCLNSNYFFYTYPLILGTTLLLCFQRDTKEKLASDRGQETDIRNLISKI